MSGRSTRAGRAAAAGVLVAAALLAPATPTAQAAVPAAATTGPAWTGWTSSATDPSARLVSRAVSTAEVTRTLQVSVNEVKQTWRGSGAALTDASTGILATSPEATARLFDPTRADGAWIDYVRLPLSATDFSTSPWVFGWNDATGTLTAPAQATTAAAFITNTILPLRPDLNVVGVPWTGPAALKTSGSLNGGALREDSVGSYGRMLVAQADWLRQRGVPVAAMSLGNEPYLSRSDYPTMVMSNAQMSALGRQIGPVLGERDVELWAVDHNWEHRSGYDAVLAGAPGDFDASAFHCYGGNPSQMAGVAAAPVMTECTGTTDGFTGTFRWDMVNLVAGPVDAGSTGLMMWNLSLNENHGPSSGGCNSCRGVIDVHSQSGALTPTPEFYTLAHLTRAAAPGARVLGTGKSNGLPYVAFRNPDGQIGLMGHNDTGSTQVVGISIDGATGSGRLSVEPGALFTLRGTPEIVGGGVNLPGVTPQVGSEIVATTGLFAPAPVALTYQWLADGAPVAGATSNRFTPGAEHVGARLTLRVTGTRSGFRELVSTSAATEPVAGADIPAVTNTTLPTISGTPQVGSTLTASPGTWTPSGTTPAYQWLAAGSPISGATATTYVPVTADVGKQLAVRVTASREGYTSSSAISASTSPVTAAGTNALLSTAAPSVSGTPIAGYQLSGSPGSWSPEPTTVDYQWLADGIAIAGATQSTFRLTADQVGTRISLAVTAGRPGYTAGQRTSAQTAVVGQGTVANTVAPSVTGTPKIGVRLRASVGSWTPAPASYRYRWLMDGRPINGATASTYVPTPGAVGHRLAVEVTASLPGWSSSAARSARTGAVVRGTLTNTARPTVTGTKRVGKTLRAQAGSWAPTGVTYRYQWWCNGARMKGATAVTFKLPASTRGKRCSVRVTATRPGYAPLTRASAATPRIR